MHNEAAQHASKANHGEPISATEKDLRKTHVAKGDRGYMVIVVVAGR